MANDANGNALNEAAARAVVTAGRDSAVTSIAVDITAVLGTAEMKVSNLLKIGRGAVIELDGRAGDTVEVRCNGLPIGRGEIVVVEDHLAVSITEIYGKKMDED
jgi:flagellar motor switch protein FliN/FliY